MIWLSDESSDGFTNPPRIESGGGIFFDFPNPIVVIITTIGLGKSKKIPPPDSIQGGFVKPSDDSSDDEIITEEVDDYHGKLDGGFVKPSDDSNK